jgi:hypothetical protein
MHEKDLRRGRVKKICSRRSPWSYRAERCHLRGDLRISFFRCLVWPLWLRRALQHPLRLPAPAHTSDAAQAITSIAASSFANTFAPAKIITSHGGKKRRGVIFWAGEAARRLVCGP